MADRREELEKYGLYDPRFEHDACGVGFVCDIKGRKSNQIVLQALEVLGRLSHRGATGADPKTGDGAGILLQMPHAFFAKECARQGISLPAEGEYGSGLVFLPREEKERSLCKKIFSRIIREESQKILGWRKVPVDDSSIGELARQTQPAIEQVFISRGGEVKDQLDFERKLYLIRKRTENELRKEKASFYITNLSSRTFSYKGLLMPKQLDKFFPDLKEESLQSALCIIHSRYSTNTFPTWDLAQPFRFLAHNGEINTLRGNINWMSARQALLESALFGRELKKIFPVIVPGGSDSAALDNVFELLVLSGRPMLHAMMMLIPSAWERSETLSQKMKDFYRYHACVMEPWDGPAAIAFTDGSRVGAVLDRNGLRPARYVITRQDTVIMASEAGVSDIAPEDILTSGRLEPGKFFYIDTQAGRIVDERKVLEVIAGMQPYGAWLKDKLLDLNEIRSSAGCPQAIAHDARILTAFGYTREDLKSIIKPMVETAQEPVGSMGLDTPHAVLSQRPQLLFNYFKQLFAQVTNPAIDPIREELVMSLSTYLGPEKNLLEESPGHCHKLFLKRPILTARELEAIRSVKVNNFKTKAISILFKADGKDGLRDALKRINREAQEAVKSGSTFIILSDRGVDKNNAAIPSLLAVASVHHHLLRRGLRISAGIVLDSGEPREVQHFALLFGYGADAVHPYLALETAVGIAKEEGLGLKPEEAIERYIEAADKGILKVLSKMGISTLQSYRGAQIFEALGLNSQVTEEYFTGTVSRIGGAGLEVIAKETLLRHYRAFAKAEPALLDSGGIYQWKKDGEFHLWNPESISCLQEAVRNNDPEKYREFSQSINDQSKNPTTLRGLFKFRAGAENIRPVPIEEVESAESIFKRFATGAMSFGSISRCAHETIAIAMNRLGGKSNTGEGGEDPQRFRPDASGDSRRSAIKQVASGRFGVTTNYLVNADELQIKIAQGAKPGEGGQLPGHKVSAVIARTRYTTEGVTLISPPPHHDIYSIEDLSQLIFDLKNVNPEARISVKLVSEIGVGTVAAGVAKGHAEMILISGGDGGTGASPLSSIRHAGLPWELGLSETHQTLLLNGLRGRVRLQTDGQMRTGRDVAIACLLGAEEFGFCTAVLITLGCVMLRHCHLNNCSVGVATQEECLEKRFAGKPEYIVNYFRFVAEELRRIMSSLGLRTIDEMVGRTDLLEVDKEMLPWKAKGLDLSKILYRPGEEDVPKNHRALKNGLINDELLDFKLIELARPAFEDLKPVKAQLPISNTDRATGALLSGRVCKAFGEAGLKEDTIAFKFKGVAGQSFGAWLAGGVTLELEGLANDYVGKGISGGKIIAYPDRRASYISEENVIIGNTAFYGALSGEAYIRGRAGERFCIRNSGLNAVVEGVGDHGCEYMTGGRVVILGSTGRNFGAGMSGGIAYIYDAKDDFSRNCNPEMVDLERINEADAQMIRRMLKEHYRYTQSPCAASVLNDPDKELARFVKVMPKEYKRLLGEDHSVKVPDLAEVYSDG